MQKRLRKNAGHRIQADLVLGVVSDCLFVKSDVQQNKTNKETLTLSYINAADLSGHNKN